VLVEPDLNHKNNFIGRYVLARAAKFGQLAKEQDGEGRIIHLSTKLLRKT
jgi:hypothetical protein